jgi:hypothetical protein
MSDAIEVAGMDDIPAIGDRPRGVRARLARVPAFAPLRIRDFRLVWFGEGVSLLGDQFHYVALSWLVLGLTGSGLALGAVLFAAAVPRGAFLLIGGALSDRVSPRTLMLGSNLLRAVITTVVAALVLGSQIEIWHLVVAGAMFGTVDAVFYPAINTIVARLVPEDRLGPANAVLQGTHQLMHTVGPAIAGFAIAIIGIGAAFVIDAVSFVVAATAIWLVRSVRAIEPPTSHPDRAARLQEPGVTTEVQRPRTSIFGSLVEGTRVVMGDSVMRILVLLSTAFNVAFTGPVVVGLPWLVQFRFGGDPATLGVLLGAFGGGSLIGVALAGIAPRKRGLGSLVLIVAMGLGVGLAAIGLSPAPVVGAILLVLGTGAGYLNVSIVAWAQARTEPHLLGRTMSFLMLGSVVGAPLSLAVAGALVDLNATALFVGAGGLIVATVLAGLVARVHQRMM